MKLLNTPSGQKYIPIEKGVFVQVPVLSRFLIITKFGMVYASQHHPLKETADYTGELFKIPHHAVLVAHVSDNVPGVIEIDQLSASEF